MVNVLKLCIRASKILVIIMILTMCFCLNSYSLERDPNSSKGFATYDDQAAAEEAKETIENDIEHQAIENNVINKSNNNYLSSLQIEGYELVPSFSKEIMEYYLDKNIEANTINISAVPDDSRATITGTGEIELNSDKESCRVEVTAESGTVRTYVIHLKTIDEAQSTTNANGENINGNNPSSNMILTIVLVLLIIAVLIIIFKINKKGN